MVPDVGSIVDRKWPKCLIKLVRPVNHHMHHHGTGPGGDRLNRSFTNSIGMVGSHTAISDRLSLQVEVLLELGCTEGLVVRMETLELDSVLMSELLEGMLPLQRISNS